MKDFSARVTNNIQYFVAIKRHEIWVRRDHLKIAEMEFQNLKDKGKIVSATFRPEWSCNGSANFLVEYPS